MKDLPKVTIIIPCRNEKKFIGKCLDSLIAQDYPKDKLEILIIDGISTDKTREIVEAYVYLKNKIFINSYLIKSGMATADKLNQYQYKNKFIELEAEVS